MTHKEALSNSPMEIMRGKNPGCEGYLDPNGQWFGMPCPACKVNHHVAVMICQTCHEAILVVDGKAHDHNQVAQDAEAMIQQIENLRQERERRIKRHIFN